ncbi:MAG: amino acid adenylation domain-containing protein, partial [Prochloraceae cyanobacterium]
MTLFLYQNIPNFTSDNCSNLVDILRKRAQAQAHQIAYTFLVDGERQEINLTYQQLDRDARAIAVHLQACCQPGDRALLLYPSGLDFIKAFFGCLYAGIVAVPAYPPRRNQNMSRLEAILKDARAKVVLTTNLISSNVEKKIVANNNELTFLHYIATDIIPQEKSSFWQEPELKQDTLTFLQYTSGSTGNPKGVMVTHANLMHNSRMIQTAFSHSEKTKFVGWLPLFHDMGLIGNVLQPMYLGIPSILMSPVAFLQKPIRWLQAISKYKATTSGGPNFAYDLCIKKIKSTEVADLDLSSWKVAFNGAEPVRVDVLDNFTKMFAPCGFKAKTFYPCYGMAESTLLITGGSVNCEPKICSVDRTFLKQNRAIDIGEKKGKKSRLVGCGQSWSNQKIVIVNPQFFTECQEEEIGEIWVKGDSVANGYWQKPELTRDIFDACLQNTGERGFLRTGDLGFVRDGELFVTGRLKDLIIIRGRNYYPQDIELVAEKSHPSLRVNCAAAFAVEIVGEKQLVIAIEVERTSLRKLNVNEVVGEIRRAISEEFHLQVYGILLLKTGTIPKTSSGKIQRSTTCDRFLLNELNLVGISLLDSSREYLDINKILDIKEEYLREDRDSIVKLLKHLVAIALNINSEHLHSKLALTSLGIDSLKAIELQNQIETYLGIFLPMTKFLSGLTIEELAKEILDSKDKATKQEGIKTVSRDRQIPLSFGSEKLWLFQELEGRENCAYNEQRSWRLTGDLNIVALKKTLLHIMQRHEILRTGFKVFNNSPVQAIDSKPILNIRVENVEYCLGKIEKIAKEEAFKPFDLSKPPLVRFTLFKLREREHVLLITIHHIICDGWSIGVFIKELSSLYQAFAAEQPSPLPELPIQYADYAVWQRESLSGELLETQLNYWKKQLSGAPELLQLPTDRPRPSVQTYRGNIQSFSINTDLSEKLQTLSRKFGTTLFMTLKAAFATLLYRYSTQSDILIGTPIANRNRSEIESSIGFFANTLVLRSSFEKNPSFEQLLGRVKETTLKAYEHQDIPFEKVVEALQPQRSLSYSPLFQVMFVLQNKAIGEVELGGVTLKELELESTIAKFDLTLSIWETERGLAGKWEYSSDLFDRATIERMAAHFENLLRAIVKNPQLSVGELPLLSEAEYHRLLVEWNDTASEYPRDKCIHQLFEEQVEKTPLSVAVVFENQRLTYQELNQKANQLARYLQSLGVEPEELVGICVEPSIDMVVGLLGILKAGGAYVPLDPNYPQERLIYILTDSGVELLLTQESLLESSPSHNARVVCLDRDWGAIEQHSQENLEVGVNSDNLAYVIYTSGSTGKPKGVLIEHKNLVHSTNARFSYYNSTLHSLLLLSSVAFDSSVAGIFWSLCSGGSLIVPKQNSLLEPLQITKLIAEHQISHLLSIPSYYGQILQHADPQALVSLHTVIVAGEVCPTTLLKLHDRAVTNASIFNEYGPTEATVWSSVYSPQDRGSQSLVPIGRPIANTQIYILDRQLQPVPIAVAGELYIGGDGLARGYLNRPELTREKFIPNPFKNSKSERLYKTGDKARYLPDGNIEFLGRIDNQVKLRGFRIELGEIEASLNTHPQVKQAIVIAKEDISGNKSLVAYVVSADRPLSSKKLRQFLASSLPEYMIPSAFVSLDTLPLTPNGKVDRKSLAELDRDLTREREYVAPRSPSEEIIANIFASVLGLPQIGIYDNFFELGGHSLLATQLISQLRATWELEIPLRAIFSSPTVAQLEPKLVQLRIQKNQLKIPPIRARKQTEALPLSWAQERLWFLNQLEGSSGTYNMPGAIRIEGDLDLNALKLALSEIVSRHEILRTSFQIFNGKPRQVIDPKATIKINPIDLKEIEATEQETLLQQQIKIEANKPFNLEIAPLIRCSLCQLDAREYILFLTMHHLVCDGWSMGIFCQELSSLYRAFSRGEPSPLPELAIQYADFALWQRKWLSKEIIETQLQYWKKQLHNAPQLLELPTARPRPRIQTYRGGTHSLSLNRDLSEKLQTLSRQTGSTLFMTLLAAFATLLSRYSSQSDILIGTPIANRHRSEIESSIGLFVNTLVIRNDLSGNPSFRELLGRVRSSSLEAYEHQDVPFEKLVEELQPERSLSYNPLFQVLFNMGNWAETQLELPGLKTEPFQTNNSLNSKFDLTLYAAEKNQKIEIELVYNSDLFASQRIVKMLQQLEYLLEQIVAEPDKSLADLSLVTPQCYQLIPEPRAVLSEQDYPNVAELFRERVKLNPENIAIVQGDLNYSYAELNQRAETIARVIKKGEVVAVSGENSFGLIASILGVVLAGGILLTIDRNLPEARKKLMWQEAQAKLILAVGSEVVIKYQEIDVISIDADSGSLSFKNLQNYEPRDICPKDPAYIFFTSGTTGTPKGVLGIHKGLSHFIEWQRNTFKVGIGDRIAQLTGLSFDVVLREIFLPLTSGATLCLPENRDDILDPIQWLKEQRITVLHTVPSLGQFWLSNSGENSLPALKWVFFAGEPLSDILVSQWRDILPHGKIVNLYGPTETTLAKCYYQIPAQIQPGIQPVGFPLPHTQALVLNSSNNLCGIGEVGQIAIRTPYRSLGYINANQEQQKRFIKNPFTKIENDLLYLSGDLGRYDSNGCLEILGRVDRQVKIRGVRIELAEIESLLTNHPQVKQAVVVVREERLVAYLALEKSEVSKQGTGKREQSIGNRQLKQTANRKQQATNNKQKNIRDFLKQKLPEYLIPSAFTIVETLPLNANGKVDRAAICVAARNALPVLKEAIENKTFISPKTLTQEIIANVFSSVLNVDLVGIEDNFFELGGHSLLATQVISRLRQSFNIDVPLRAIFESPTVAKLERLINPADVSQIEEIEIIERDGEDLPLSFAQERLWILDRLVGKSSTYNIPVAVSICGSLDIFALDKAFSEIIRRHEVLRTRFRSIDGIPVQAISPPNNFKISTIEVLEEEVQSHILQQTQTPFDLSEDNLVRSSLLCLGDREYILVIVMHHIVADGWSLGVFIRELCQLYRDFSQGKPSTLPPLPIQYFDYAVWQRQWLDSTRLSVQIDYWQEKLANVPSQLKLPIDRTRPDIMTFNGSRESLDLDLEIVKELKNLSLESGTTLYMTMLAALKVLLSYYSEQEDIVVGSPIANRNRSEIEPLIGFFVNVLVLRSHLGGNPSFLDVLERVKTTCLEAYNHQDLPFEQLISQLGLERDLSLPPLVQVIFTFHNMPEVSLGNGDLNVSLIEIPSKKAKTDLSFIVLEEKDKLTLNLEYNTDLFERETIRKILVNFKKLLKTIVKNPQQNLTEILLESSFSQKSGSILQTETIYKLSNLTQNQLLMWLGQQLNPEKPIYNNLFVSNITNAIDLEYFQKAFQTVINASDALSTVITANNGIPKQKVIPFFPYLVECIDFSEIANAREQAMKWSRDRASI